MTLTANILLVEQYAQRELEFDGKLPTGQKCTGAIEDTVISIAAMAEGLETGTDAQKFLILFEMEQLIQQSHSVEFIFRTFVPALCRNAVEWPRDLQICAAEALVGIVGRKCPEHIAKSISSTAFNVLCNSNDSDLFRVWGEILVATLPHVNWSREHLELILANLDEQQMPGSTGCDLAQKLIARVIGPIALLASPDLTKSVLLTRALILTEETDIEIRGMVVESMAYIGAAIDIDTVEDLLWPRLVDLVKDPNARLRAATLRTISRISAAHRKFTPTAAFFTHLLPPVFIRECKYVQKVATADQRLINDDVYLLLEVNAEIFGELLFSTHNYLSEEMLRLDAFRAFQAMATCNGPVIRRYCAFNVPGVALSVNSEVLLEMSSLVEFLSRETDAETRWNLAAGIHATAQALCCAETIDSIFRTINTMLHDESQLVRINVLQNLNTLLGNLVGQNPLKVSLHLVTVFQNLQRLSEGSWRNQELLVIQLRLTAHLVPQQCIRANVLPLLYRITNESSYMVRKASMGAAAVFIRYLSDTTERNEAMESLRVEWARGRIHWKRLGFLDSAEIAMGTYSRILFRDTFGVELLRLSQDPVSNVRIRAATLMEKIAPACHMMDGFRVALMALMKDSDLDVASTLDGIEARIQKAIATGRSNFEVDLTREAEEQDLYSKHLLNKAETFKKNKPVVVLRSNTLFGLSGRRHKARGVASHVGVDQRIELALPNSLSTPSAADNIGTAASIAPVDAESVSLVARPRLPRVATMTGRSVGSGKPKPPRANTFAGNKTKLPRANTFAGESTHPMVLPEDSQLAHQNDFLGRLSPPVHMSPSGLTSSSRANTGRAPERGRSSFLLPSKTPQNDVAVSPVAIDNERSVQRLREDAIEEPDVGAGAFSLRRLAQSISPRTLIGTSTKAGIMGRARSTYSCS
jgi:hypothetical protein